MSKKFHARWGEKEYAVSIESLPHDRLRIQSEDQEWELDVHQAGPSHYSVLHDGRSYDVRFFHREDGIDAFWRGEHVTFQIDGARRPQGLARGQAGGVAIEGPVEIRAMMPGKIASIPVKEGDEVVAGQGVVVLEAMKMENELAAPKSGKIVKVAVKEGASVESGAVLVIIE